jgi:hypothetical protein
MPRVVIEWETTALGLRPEIASQADTMLDLAEDLTPCIRAGGMSGPGEADAGAVPGELSLIGPALRLGGATRGRLRAVAAIGVVRARR